MNFFLYAYSYTQTGGSKVTVRQRAMNGMEGREGEVETKCASAGNRTRVTSMATMYSTTRPLMLLVSLGLFIIKAKRLSDKIDI